MKCALLYLFCITIIISQNACDSQGHGGVSSNVKESRYRKIFVAEYEARPNPCYINDSLKINVTSAWVENQWAYGKYNDETIIIEDKYQLVIEVKPNNLKNYESTWTIGIDGSRYIRSCGSNCLMTDFDTLTKDIEEWKVQDGSQLDSLSTKTIIGTFKIYKK